MAGSVANITTYTWNSTTSKYEHDFTQTKSGWQLVEPATLLSDIPKDIPGYPTLALITSLFLGVVYILYKKKEWKAN
ncbi:MAG: Loki-CTERM sorting domain-containing protein [Promethearchaeota archaeon]